MQRITAGTWRSKATGAVLLAVGLLFGVLAGAPAPSAPPHAAAAVSAAAPDAPMPGGLEVQPTSMGSFTHSIDIAVPGFRGLEPHVSLDYDSSGGNGPVGVGWRLQAGSSIVRSGPHGSLPRYDSSDVFLVDGAQLVACAPHCRTGGTHETIRQTFERYIFDGTAWTRWHRDGVRLDYQPEATGGDPFRWALARLTDTHGNTVDFAEDCPENCYPGRITYGADTHECGQSGQEPCRAGADVRFHYELRPDAATYSTGRILRHIKYRLRSVEVRMDDHLVRAYALAYDLSRSTGRSVLRSVQQFPSDASVAPDGTVSAGTMSAGKTAPLPPVTFETASTGMPGPTWQQADFPAPLAASLALPASPRTYPDVHATVPGDIRPPRLGGETGRAR